MKTNSNSMRHIIENMLNGEADPEKLFALGRQCLGQKLLPEANRYFAASKPAVSAQRL